MSEFFILVPIFIVGGIIFAAFQRKFSSETLANGMMDSEKGKEIAPTIFKGKDQE